MSDTRSVAIPAPAGLGPVGAQLYNAFAATQNFMRQPAIVRSMPIIVVSMIVLVGLGTIFMMREPAMTQLFPRLGDEDKSLVLQNLETNGIKAKLDPTTGTLMVPRNDFHRARMSLAAAGLPKAAIAGYDIISQMPLGASRAVETVKLKQAQENELSRSIMEIRDVEGARVHLAIPERSAFVREQNPPSASVFLRLSPGRSLSLGQVQSIQHLVSSSVPYLPVANVTIVDQSGALLSSPQRDNELGLSSQQLEHKTRIEKMLRERVANLLTPIIGIGNFNSEVNVEVDFTRSEQTNETYDPSQQAIRSRQETVQESADGKARGVPGATSNQPPNTPALTATPPGGTAAGATDPSKARSSTTVSNYEVSREVRSTKRAVGEIKRVSMAVVVRSGTIIDEAGKSVEKPMSDGDRERLTSLLQEAVGYVPDRGDKITLISSSFADEQKLESRSWYDAPWLEDAIKQVAIVSILGVVVLGALKPFLERLLDRTMSGSMASDEPVLGDGESIEVREGETLEDIKARLKPKKNAISAEMLDTANTYDDKVTLIRMLVGDDAARVTAVLKTLIQRDA